MTHPITCPNFAELPKIRHGFFTRNGGASSGIYASLNLGTGSRDDAANVQQNRHIVMQTFLPDAPDKNLHTLYQIHSNKVVTVTGEFHERQEADALVTAVPNMVLGILTADCTPVLFADSKANIVGAAHAGWKGAFSGILQNTVSAMEALGSTRQNIHAAIGPTISQKSYEVGSEFLARFLDDHADNQRFFIPSQKEGHWMFDLPEFVTSRLEALGLHTITNVRRDTCAEEENFFSYRRSCLKGEPDYGRNLSVIAVK